MTEPLAIDVISDVVCPWCYLGKRRLEVALCEFPAEAVSVRWRPYRLDPRIPSEGMDRVDYLLNKFRDVDAVLDAHRQLTLMGAEEGIEYHFETITREPNTVDAHRLIRWAGMADLEEPMVERLFAAFFTEGRDIGDKAVLAQLAGEAGLEGDVAARLASNEDRALVVNEIENAYRIGLNGVPAFIFDMRTAVVGAQSPETIAKGIRQAIATIAEGAEA